MQRRMCRCFTFFSRIWTKVILLWIKLKLKESWKPKFGEDFSLNLKKCLKPVKACDTSPVCQTLKVKLRLFIKFPTSVQRWKTWDTIKRFPTHCRKFQPFSIFHTWINDSESPCLSGHMDNNVETVVFESVLSGTYILTTALIPALKKASDRSQSGACGPNNHDRVCSFHPKPTSRVSVFFSQVTVSSGGMLTQKLNVEDLQFEKGTFDGTMAYAQNKVKEALVYLNLNTIIVLCFVLTEAAGYSHREMGRSAQRRPLLLDAPGLGRHTRLTTSQWDLNTQTWAGSVTRNPFHLLSAWVFSYVWSAVGSSVISQV